MARQKLPETVRRLWRQIAVGRGLLAGLVSAAPAAGLVFADNVTPVIFAAPVVFAAVVIAIGWWWAGRKWRSWSFELTDRWITAQNGVWTQRSVTIPRNRVQTVTTGNGPLDRLLKLTSITVHTAGSASPNLFIPHLEDSTVQWLRTALGQGVTGF